MVPDRVEPAQAAAAAASCETWSPRQGCIGGSRKTEPAWSPRQGYHGSGSPADRARQAEYERQGAVAVNEAPTFLRSCDSGGCWALKGRRLNNAPGGTFIRAVGKHCRMLGRQVQCN